MYITQIYTRKVWRYLRNKPGLNQRTYNTMDKRNKDTNYQQNTTQKTKDWVTQISQKPCMNSGPVRLYIVYRYIITSLCWSSLWLTSLMLFTIYRDYHTYLRRRRRRRGRSGRKVVRFTNYQCNQCPSPLTLWGLFPIIARCTRYNIMW